METKSIVELAIKRHDIDASWFQQQYENNNDPRFNPFLYGRTLVINELSNILSQLPAGAKILDVGSGTGHLSFWISKKGFDITGVEPSEKMLDLARRNFPQLKFIKGISSELPFDDKEFHLIISFEVLRYLNCEENINTYREYYRVLKPSGKIFVTHVNKFASDFYYFFYYIKKIIYKLQNKVYHYCYFTTPKKEESLLKGIGFSCVESIGIMRASLRIAYKLGTLFSNTYLWVINKLFKSQRFLNYPSKAIAGHLVIVATK